MHRFRGYVKLGRPIYLKVLLKQFEKIMAEVKVAEAEKSVEADVAGYSADLYISAIIKPWRMFQYDARHTGRFPKPPTAILVAVEDGTLHALNPDGTLKWKYVHSDRFEYIPPSIDWQGRVYFIDVNYYLYRYSVETGLEGLSSVEYWFIGTPAIGDDGTIYVPHGDGYLYAFNPDFTLKWQFPLKADVSYPTIGDDGTIYVTSDRYVPDEGYLYAINPDGTLKFVYDAGTPTLVSTPAVASDGTVYFGDRNGYLHAVNPDGTLKWKYYTGGRMFNYITPSIGDDGTIYIATAPTELHAVNPDGTKKWSYKTGGTSAPSKAVAIGSDGTIYLSDPSVEAPGLYAINPDGTLKWRYTIDGAETAPAIDGDGTIYVGAYTGSGAEGTGVYAINPDGTLKWFYFTGRETAHGLAIA